MLAALAVAIVIVVGSAAWWYQTVWRAPSVRPGAGEFYPGAPESAQRHYLDLPLDHAHPERGTFRGYYVLSPRFRAGGPVVFLLIDGQMELDSPNPDFEFFDGEVPVDSYVIIGHRGHSPVLLPEVYRDGRVDPREAMALYASTQQVEDIERVRLDMQRRGLLPPDGKVDLFGASGAGVLVQQFLDRHPQSVRRACLVSTGAPDISRRLGLPFARDYRELLPDAGQLLDDARRAGVNIPDLGYVIYQLGREGVAGQARANAILRDAAGGRTWPMRRAALSFSKNRALVRFLLASPREVAVRVRMFELLGEDLAARSSSTNLLATWSADFFSDFAGLTPPRIDLDRRKFDGEVLVIAGTHDVVFSPRVAAAIAREYPHARYVEVPGGHRLELRRDQQLELRRTFFNPPGPAAP